jgi:hypothetical protein
MLICSEGREPVSEIGGLPRCAIRDRMVSQAAGRGKPECARSIDKAPLWRARSNAFLRAALSRHPRRCEV